MAAAGALPLALLAGGCAPSHRGGAGEGGVSATPTTVDPIGRLTSVADGLCDARHEVAADAGRARTIFYDRVHGGLHTLARELQGRDRAAAARLLEAKEAVEADLTAQPARPTVASDLGRLDGLTRRGLAVLGARPRPCDERSGG